MKNNGTRRAFAGRTNKKGHHFWYDQQGQVVVEFDVASERYGETEWVRAICQGKTGLLARDHIHPDESVRVEVEGTMEDKGRPDSKTGRWFEHLVCFVHRLKVAGEEAEDTPEREKQNTPTPPSEEAQALALAKHLEQYPHRWNRPLFDTTSYPHLQEDQERWARGEREIPDLHDVPQEAIASLIRGLSA